MGKIDEEEESEEQMLWKGKERNAIVMRYEVIRMSWKITEDVEDNWDTTIRSNTTREGEAWKNRVHTNISEQEGVSGQSSCGPIFIPTPQFIFFL